MCTARPRSLHAWAANWRDGSSSPARGRTPIYALASGPARSIAGKESLFDELGYRDAADATCLVLEVDKRPPAALIDQIIEACGIAASNLTLILTPTRSLAGTVQIVGRVLEVALHKLHELHFPLDRVIDGMGAAPLPPPAKSFVEAMGRTNDAIIYGGLVHLFVTGPDDEARQLAEQLPSKGSRDYGRPFAEIFNAYKGDFYAMDRLLFSPAQAVVTALDSGRSFHGGALDEALIDRSFGYAAAKIAIFAERLDWHARQLRDAFAGRGADVRYLALASCGFRTAGDTQGLHLPKFR